MLGGCFKVRGSNVVARSGEHVIDFRHSYTHCVGYLNGMPKGRGTTLGQPPGYSDNMDLEQHGELLCGQLPVHCIEFVLDAFFAHKP